MSLLQHAAAIPVGDTGYDIDNSYKNENDNTERMYRAWGGITANTRTWTTSLWIKRTELGACYIWGAGVSGNDVVVVDFDSSDRLGFRSTKDAANDCVYRTNRVFRDTAAWYHLVFAVDTTSSTAGNRLRIYVNGVEETSFATETNFDQNDLTLHNANSSYMEVGSVIGESPRFNGYIAEVNSITGTQYASTAFGKFDDDSGIWIPIKFTGSYAENSVFLEFKDSSSLGTDTSGNGQTFTLQNLSAADQATDTPTNNFCTLNPLIPYAVQSGTPAITEGATYHNGSGGWTGMKGTIGVNKGKWYWELKTNSGTGAELIHGIQTVTSGTGESTATSAHNLLETAAWYVNGGHWIKDETSGRDDIAAGSVTQTYGNSVIHAVALNMDDDEITYYANGSVVSGLNEVDLDGLAGETVAPFASVYNQQLAWNFGGYTTISISSAATDANGYGTFEYAPPSGYYALCTKNLEEYG
jgi:hypothetical protein